MKYISQAGLGEHKKELEELKRQRLEIAKRLEEAKALGDLSENYEYLAAREAQAFNEGKILELEQFLREAVVINEKSQKTNIVQIGYSVEVKSNGRMQVFTIVGPEEANPSFGKISNESPLGKAFLGCQVGETVEVETPGGKVSYRIVSIK